MFDIIRQPTGYMNFFYNIMDRTVFDFFRKLAGLSLSLSRARARALSLALALSLSLSRSQE